jgi:hypothetical protein
MSKHSRLSALESAICPPNKYHWWQAWQPGPGHDVLTMAAIYCQARGYDVKTIFSDEQFTRLTGVNHALPVDVIRQDLVKFLTGLAIWPVKEIEANPSWCLASWLMAFIDTARQHMAAEVL